MTQNSRKPLIQAINLKKHFKVPGKGVLHAVDDVSFEIYEGETLGLVGESGCGKSTVGNVIMRLLNKTDGQLLYHGKDVFAAKGKESLEYKKNMQIIFQDPYSSLNPKKTVKSILSEAYKVHNIARGSELDKLLAKLCEEVGITQDLWNAYPHELDGGKRQIVGIARALSLNPQFIVCDEPVSSLDVSIQANIINLLIDIQKKMHLSYLFISHDLSVVRHISDRIAVMYLGKIVEIAEADEMFSNTLHPYSIALLSAVPRVNVSKNVARILLKGDVPSPMNPKPGCRFAPRCWMAEDICFKEEPKLTEECPGHCVACHFSNITREKAKSAKTMSIAEK
jgi:oligopeptide/dipeptide ABC transporter, ATP-binding protein, C-terminal domain